MVATALSAQTIRVIDVTDWRPLSTALDQLELLGGTAINYEDPPYENQADLEDVSALASRPLQPGDRLFGPRNGHVVAEIQGPQGMLQENDTIFNINLLLASYRQGNLPGDFEVEQANGMLYVVPTKVLGASGAVRNVTSPMRALVTVPEDQRTVADAAQAIFDAVYRATGLRIAIGSFPFWPTDKVEFGANKEPARDALARLFAKMNRHLSYRLVFDPRPNRRIFDYMINVQPTGYVPPTAPPNAGPTVAAPGPTASSQQPAGAGPGFVKTKP